MFPSNTSAFSTWTGVNSTIGEQTQEEWEEKTLNELIAILHQPLYNLFPHFC